VLKNDRARIIKDAVEDEAVSTAVEELCQLGLALLDRFVPETVTIEFEKIEGTEDCGVMMQSPAEQLKVGQAVAVARDALCLRFLLLRLNFPPTTLLVFTLPRLLEIRTGEER